MAVRYDMTLWTLGRISRRVETYLTYLRNTARRVKSRVESQEGLKRRPGAGKTTAALHLV